MAIYSKCCGINQSTSKRKCEKCGKNFHTYSVKVKNSVSGKWRTKIVPTLKLAKEVESKFKIEILEGNVFDKKKHSEINFEKYLKYAELHKKTWKMDKSRWDNHIRGKDFLSKRGIVNILTTMKKTGYSESTVHHVLKLIRRVYNWHIQNDLYFQANPCKTITLPPYDNKVTNYLSHDDVVHLTTYLDTWDNFRASNVILFALFTGRRKGEVTNLEWSDINLEEKVITCRKTKNGKTLSFPLNQKAYDIILRAHKEKLSKYVFPSSTGHHYYNGFSLAWRRLQKRIGLTYRFHDLRHTYASHLASSGKVDIYTLKTLLGHQDITLTMRYAHLSNDAIKKATSVIDEIF